MDKKHLRRIGAAVGVALVAAAPALAAGTTTVVVDQSSFSTTPVNPGTGWGVAPDSERPSGRIELVAGPGTAPLGLGSLRISNTAADQLSTVRSTALAGTELAKITGAKYSTFVDADSAPGPQQISLKMGVTGAGTTLVFEPYFADNAGASQKGVWKTWDAAAATTGWWDTARTSACTQDAPCSFAEIKAEFAGATISDVRLAAGSGLSNFDGYADAVELTVGANTVRYNFESNKARDDVMTRVDDTAAAGWGVEGSTGSTEDGQFAVTYVKGPNLPGLGGAGSARLAHTGPGTYSALVQDYLAKGDLSQTYLGDLDDITLQTYRLAESTKADYPSVRFEVRLPDPETQFAFASIVHVPGNETTGNLDLVHAIHGTSSADAREWNLTRDIAGLQAGTSYTWAELMRTELRDAVIVKALVAAGSGTGPGTFVGGVDYLKFDFRDGSSQTWNFEKAGVYPAPPTTTTPTDADKTPPVVAITTANNTVFTPGDGISITGTAVDAGTGVAKIGVYFVDALGKKVGGGFVCTACGTPAGETNTWELTSEDLDVTLLPGQYKAFAYAADGLGNGRASAPVTVVVTV